MGLFANSESIAKDLTQRSDFFLEIACKLGQFLETDYGEGARFSVLIEHIGKYRVYLTNSGKKFFARSKCTEESCD